MTATASPSAPATPAARLLGLDALRGIAAFCVVLFHVRTVFETAPQYSPRAYLAVDFFFVLSGFVMARAYETKLRAGFGGDRFFKARYRRLWPTIAFGSLLFVPYVREAADGFNLVFFKVFIANMLLLPAIGENDFFPLNAPAWSIFFELVANVIHGMVLWKLRSRALLAIVLVCLCGLAFKALDYGNLDVGAGKGEFVVGLLRVGFSYTLGILLWRHWGERKVHRSAGWLALVAMPILFASITHGVMRPWETDLTFVTLASPLILVGGLAIRGGGRLAALAGDLSFPLYATHFPVLYIARDLGLSGDASIAACLVVAGAVTAVQLAWRQRRKSLPQPAPSS